MVHQSRASRSHRKHDPKNIELGSVRRKKIKDGMSERDERIRMQQGIDPCCEELEAARAELVSLRSQLADRDKRIAELETDNADLKRVMVENEKVNSDTCDEYDKRIAELEAECERLGKLFDDLAAELGWTKEQCEQDGDSPFDAARGLMRQVKDLAAAEAECERLRRDCEPLKDAERTLANAIIGGQKKRIDELRGLLAQMEVDLACPVAEHLPSKQGVVGSIPTQPANLHEHLTAGLARAEKAEAECERLKSAGHEWLKANGSGGWIDNLRSLLRDALEMLERLEWDTVSTCLVCDWHIADGHRPDCALVALLVRIKEAVGERKGGDAKCVPDADICRADVAVDTKQP